MRTTVNLTPDLEAEVARLKREQGMGTSEAVVALARRGMLNTADSKPFTQRTRGLGMRLDVSNIAEVLDLLDDA